MKGIATLIFTVIALLAVTASALSPSVKDEYQNDVFQGLNFGFGVVTDNEEFADCEFDYIASLKMIGLLTENMFTNWNVAYLLVDNFLGITVGNELLNWSAACHPVSDAYSQYFAKAIDAHAQNPTAFWETVKNNFEANQLEIAIIAKEIADSVVEGNYFAIGEFLAFFVKDLLQTWL